MLHQPEAPEQVKIVHDVEVFLQLLLALLQVVVVPSRLHRAQGFALAQAKASSQVEAEIPHPVPEPPLVVDKVEGGVKLLSRRLGLNQRFLELLDLAYQYTLLLVLILRCKRLLGARCVQKVLLGHKSFGNACTIRLLALIRWHQFLLVCSCGIVGEGTGSFA